MLKIVNVAAVTMLILSNTVSAEINTERNVPSYKSTQAGLYITSKNAYAALQEENEKILFIDVRTRGEVAYVGMPTSADANVPFMFTSKKYQWDENRNNFKMAKNDKFVETVTKRLKDKKMSKNGTVFVMCRSGGRSAAAANALTKAGFTRVFSVIDGFEGDSVKSGDDAGKRVLNGWKNSNLPWSFSLDKNKMFLKSKKSDGHKKINKMLKKMDSNKDNNVTQNEFDAFHKKMFGNIDHNHDGILDEEELKAFKKHKKEKMK